MFFEITNHEWGSKFHLSTPPLRLAVVGIGKTARDELHDWSRTFPLTLLRHLSSFLILTQDDPFPTTSQYDLIFVLVSDTAASPADYSQHLADGGKLVSIVSQRDTVETDELIIHIGDTARFYSPIEQMLLLGIANTIIGIDWTDVMHILSEGTCACYDTTEFKQFKQIDKNARKMIAHLDESRLKFDLKNCNLLIHATIPFGTRLEDLTALLDRIRAHISAFDTDANILYQCTFNKDKKDKSGTISWILCNR